MSGLSQTHDGDSNVALRLFRLKGLAQLFDACRLTVDPDDGIDEGVPCGEVRGLTDQYGKNASGVTDSVTAQEFLGDDRVHAVIVGFWAP